MNSSKKSEAIKRQHLVRDLPDLPRPALAANDSAARPFLATKSARRRLRWPQLTLRSSSNEYE